MNEKKAVVGIYFGIPLPIWVMTLLILGLSSGYFFPKSPVLNAIYLSGTIFPKLVATLAALLIFILLSSAMAKLVQMHKENAGKMFGIIFLTYLSLGLISLVYVASLIPFLTKLPITLPGEQLPGALEWVTEIAKTFSGVLTQQPLLQALLGSMVIGYFSAKIPRFHRIARGFIWLGDWVLKMFRALLWYYPVMIGCLAIGIPAKFGAKGLILYGQTVLWVALVTLSWSVLTIIAMKLFTKRSFKQIASYYATVWPTGFGTGGSYDTLAVNIVSAKEDLGLRPEVAESSIIFGTVLNKNTTTMAVLLVTITVSRMLEIPISLSEILFLIPPVLILGFESPGIPGGAGFFMSPIIATLLNVPDIPLFVTTFVSIYSGLIPMFATAGNTTDDGAIGAFIQDLLGTKLFSKNVQE